MSGLSSFIAACLLSLTHIFVGRLRFLDAQPHSAWLSLSGGAAVAYVFAHLLPKLAQKQEILLNASDTGLYGLLEHHAYLVALAGFVGYYGIGRAAVFAKAHVLPVQVVGFAAYSVLIGYLVADSLSFVPLALVTIAMILHFLGTDHGLRHHYDAVYDRVIRWVLALSIFVGWGIGLVTEVAETTVALWFAFLAGGIVINVIKEDVLAEQHGRFWPFLVGVAAFTLLVLAIEWFLKTEDEVPLISGIALAVDTSSSDDGGKAAAFIKRIEFLE